MKLSVTMALLMVLITATSLYSKDCYYEQTFKVTAYSHQHKTCYDGYGCICETSQGHKPKHGTVACRKGLLKYGTKVYIPGYGYGVIDDRSSDLTDLDVWFETKTWAQDECYDLWGVKYVKVRIYY